mmetsp:Transcript_14534/g.43676  ORF Transcript_14534/g.43676 Transcript_14534/m.43676 type:complete len:218 (-) Transcript_14534:954-1607(-)
MVRGLVQNKSVHLPQREARQQRPRARAGIELPDGAVHLLPREAVLHQAHAGREGFDAGELGDELARRLVARQRLMLLREAPEGEVPPHGHVAAERRDAPRDGAQQRALAGAVEPHDRHALPKVHPQRYRRQRQRLASVAEHGRPQDDRGVAPPGNVLQDDAQRRAVHHAVHLVLLVPERFYRLGLLPRPPRAVPTEVALHDVVVRRLVPLPRGGRRS